MLSLKNVARASIVVAGAERGLAAAKFQINRKRVRLRTYYVDILHEQTDGWMADCLGYSGPLCHAINGL